AISYVVPYVVCYDRGVAGVVLWDVSLDLTHEVGAHVSRLCVDASGDPHEHRYQGRSEAKTRYRRGVRCDRALVRDVEERKTAPATTTATGAMTLYSLERKALAPSLTALEISCILGVPGFCDLTLKIRMTAYTSATTAPPTATRPKSIAIIWKSACGVFPNRL